MAEAAETDPRERSWSLAAAVILSLATLVSAWCGYQASVWNGVVSTQTREANAARLDSARHADVADRQLSSDLLIFAVWLRWLPANGYVPLLTDPVQWAAHLVLPVVTLSLVQGAVLIRYVRSAFVEVLNEDYYRTARAIGWTPTAALLRHGVRNAAVSLVTVLGLQLSSVLVGAIVVEQVFALPGLGTLLLTSVAARDVFVIQGTVMFLVLAVLAISAIVDFSYLLIDPRQRTGGDQE